MANNALTPEQVTHEQWVVRERHRLQVELDAASKRLREAEAAELEAEKSYGNARRALDGFNKGYGR